MNAYKNQSPNNGAAMATMFVVASLALLVIAALGKFVRMLGYMTPLAMLLLVATDAEACRRCGRSQCVFQHHVAAAPVYVAPEPTVTNFVFNNQSPPLIQGSSVYGFSLAATPFDPNLFANRAFNYLDAANQSMRQGFDGAREFGAQALAVNESTTRRITNTAIAQAALAANSDNPPTTTQAFRVTISGAEIRTERIDLTPPGDDPDQPPAAFSALSCAKCHDGKGGAGRPPAALVFDGSTPISDKQYEAAAKAIMAGTMPPNSDWNVDQKSTAVAALAKLLGH